MYMHMYIEIYIICVFTHICVLTSAAQIKVEFELYVGQSVVDYMCISNLPMNIYYYS